MELIQGTFDKYDSLIFQTRNWFVTIWLAAQGFAFSSNRPDLAGLAALACVVFWLFEGLVRHEYWYKYVVRYRALRDWLNLPDSSPEMSIYDLTNHYGQSAPRSERFAKSFLKTEPTIVYGLMALASVFLRSLVPVE
ncbi:MAG: hypothetical protein IPL75_12385 [Acidobacteria bacterium]|nr:hypothetical protein [Acidobacteriota bacterium]